MISVAHISKAVSKYLFIFAVMAVKHNITPTIKNVLANSMSNIEAPLNLMVKNFLLSKKVGFKNIKFHIDATLNQ